MERGLKRIKGYRYLPELRKAIQRGAQNRGKGGETWIKLHNGGNRLLQNFNSMGLNPWKGWPIFR
jgi:hypothetical protein